MTYYYFLNQFKIYGTCILYARVHLSLSGDGGTAERCMAISGFHHDEWDDRNCTKELRSICECNIDPGPV